MIRILLISIFAFASIIPALGQQRIAAAAAMLQLTGKTLNGEEVTVSSSKLIILYDPGIAKGELPLSSLTSGNGPINDSISTLAGRIVYFTIEIPEGKFTFGDSMNEKFSTRGKLTLDDFTSEFTVEFDVSNIKNSNKNTFKVIGMGRLSLRENFGVFENTAVQDSFGFIFNQNLNLYSP